MAQDLSDPQEIQIGRILGDMRLQARLGVMNNNGTLTAIAEYRD
jgi:hypothetical protein